MPKFKVYLVRTDIWTAEVEIEAESALAAEAAALNDPSEKIPDDDFDYEDCRYGLSDAWPTEEVL